MTVVAWDRPVVEVVDGCVVVDSLKLAACCAREHFAVLAAIRKALTAYPELVDEVLPATYRGRNGHELDAYYLGYRPLVATFRFLRNMPGRFDKDEVLFQYRVLFVQAGVIPADRPVSMPGRREPAPEPEPETPIPWPTWAITEGQLVNAVWDDLLAKETA
jgi:hypothetical protein